MEIPKPVLSLCSMPASVLSLFSLLGFLSFSMPIPKLLKANPSLEFIPTPIEEFMEMFFFFKFLDKEIEGFIPTPVCELREKDMPAFNETKPLDKILVILGFKEVVIP
ncbi:MAG: hypothetical protein R3B93_19145 [Bacteroidia bacterium]